MVTENVHRDLWMSTLPCSMGLSANGTQGQHDCSPLFIIFPMRLDVLQYTIVYPISRLPPYGDGWLSPRGGCCCLAGPQWNFAREGGGQGYLRTNSFKGSFMFLPSSVKYVLTKKPCFGLGLVRSGGYLMCVISYGRGLCMEWMCHFLCVSQNIGRWKLQKRLGDAKTTAPRPWTSSKISPWCLTFRKAFATVLDCVCERLTIWCPDYIVDHPTVCRSLCLPSILYWLCVDLLLTWLTFW